MSTFDVVLTVQSPGNPAVDINYGRKVGPATAAATVARLLADYSDEAPPSNIPESIEPKLVGIFIAPTLPEN